MYVRVYEHVQRAVFCCNPSLTIFLVVVIVVFSPSILSSTSYLTHFNFISIPFMLVLIIKQTCTGKQTKDPTQSSFPPIEKVKIMS